MWKIANIVSFSCTKPYAAKTVPLKTGILYRSVEFLYKWSSIGSVNVKINLNIIFSEVTTDYI